MRRTTSFALSLSAILLAGRASATVTQITACGIITAPGQYHVSQALNGVPGAACIDVESTQNVQIHLDGNTILGGILVNNSTNVSITGPGTLQGYYGVKVFSGSLNSVVDVTMNTTAFNGGNGIDIESSPDATVISNTLTFRSGSLDDTYGIEINGGNGSVVRSNTVTGYRFGILVTRTSGSIVQANDVSQSEIHDLTEDDPCGANTWKANQYGTSTGCI